MDTEVIIDVQGFKDNRNLFIVKEVAILHNLEEYQQFLIRPPYDFSYLSEKEQKQSIWIQKNHHGIAWNRGSVKYASVKTFLRDNISTQTKVFVKGHEKKQWIKSILGEKGLLINVEELGCNSFRNLKKEYSAVNRCVSHSGCCALENVFLLKRYIENK